MKASWKFGATRDRTLLFVGFVACLAGQVLLSPPWRQGIVGSAVCAVAVVFWCLGNKSTLTFMEVRYLSQPLKIRWLFLLVSALLASATFVLFRTHRFDLVNTGLWMAAVTSGILSLWGSGSRAKDRNTNGRLVWPMVVVFGLVCVFRLASLDAIPHNPWSDHTEKLEDIYDLADGNLLVFFPRNTGREPFQFYWTYAVGKVLGTGVSFDSLKLGTALLGLLAVIFVFGLGRFLGGSMMALMALYLYGLAYWPNLMARIGLRFPLYPLFTAAFLFFVFRALYQGQQSDWVLAGLSLGFGLHGYSPFRVVPLLAVVLVGILYGINRKVVKVGHALVRVGIVAFLAFLVFLPLARFAWDRPDLFWHRASTRWASAERPVAGNSLAIFGGNVARALAMFNWDAGELFAVSIPHRPALDAVTAALFLLGAAMALKNAVFRRGFAELSLLVSIVVLQLPSTLSLAFPNENPAPNRAGAAAIPAILLAAWAGTQLWEKATELKTRWRVLAFGCLAVLGFFVAMENWQQVMRYGANNRLEQFDTPAMASVIQGFLREGGTVDDVAIIRVPHWVDTRLPALLAGIPHRDLGLDREELGKVLEQRGRYLILTKDDDEEVQKILKENGWVGQFHETCAPDRGFCSFRNAAR